MKRFLFAILLSLVLAPVLHAATVKILNGTIATWHTGSGTLASNARATSAAITITAGEVGYPKATCEFNMAAVSSGSVVANSNVAVWFVLDPNGTNFETLPSPRIPDFTFPLAAGTGAQRVVVREVLMPAQNGFQIDVLNNGTGATFATAWTIRCTPYTQQIN